MFLDNTFQKSQVFSSLKDMLVVSIGFDKSDSDCVGTMRPCNRKKDNTTVYVQCVCCLEGPISENYENEIKTVGNNDFPVRSTVQSMVDETLFALVLSSNTTGKITSCMCFVFEPMPTLAQCVKRVVKINLNRTVVPDEDVLWSTSTIAGYTPDVPVELDSNEIDVALIIWKDDPLVVVGLQFSKGGEMVCNWKLGEKYILSKDERLTCEVQCQ